MSAFSPVKTIILAYLKDMPLDLKKDTVKVLEALDNDLDVANYIPSSVTEEAIDKFNSTLRGVDTLGEGDVEEDEDDEEEDEEAEFPTELEEDDEDDDDDIEFEDEDDEEEED